MAKKAKRDGGLPLAIATHFGLVATLIVLLIGTVGGMRAWMLLIKSAMAFLLVSAFLRLSTAATLHFIRWKATPPKPRNQNETEEVRETARTISSAVTPIPDSMESPAS